jgi:hypothetical protein
MEFRFQPDVFERGHVGPDRTDTDADLLPGTSERFGRSGVTRRTVSPGLCGKCGIVFPNNGSLLNRSWLPLQTLFLLPLARVNAINSA